MDKLLDASSYGICLFSLDVLQDFLKREKIRTRKLLQKLQKDKDLYLATQKEGCWLPIAGIASYEYVVKVEGYDEPFDNEWEQKLEYGGFNLEIRDSLCISSIGAFYNFDANDFSEYETSYQTMDGHTKYRQFKYDIPSGKYLVTIRGYAHMTAGRKNPKYGYQFSLAKADAFEGFKNPREDELYEFDVSWLTYSKKATVYWLPEEEGGGNRASGNTEYRAVIQPDGEALCHIYMRFDRAASVQNALTSKCRMDNTLHYKNQDDLFYSGAEYPIYEETRKRGKSTLTEVGRIVIA